MKFRIIVADPPWAHSDGLNMSSTKRSGKSVYKNVMPTKAIKALEVESLAQKDAVLALWVPGTHLQEGLDTMKAWGFDQKQVWVWVKTKKRPLEGVRKLLIKSLSKIEAYEGVPKYNIIRDLWGYVEQDWDVNSILNFYMGRMFRQTHEICLIGTRGKIVSKIQNKSQRSVHMEPIGSHSEKPEALQDMLEIMFGKRCNKLELFARRDRDNWICTGNECPSTMGEDVVYSINRLRKQ